MPERLSSFAFWAIFAGIVFAVAYPTLQAMRDDQAEVAASPSPAAIGALDVPALPAGQRSPIAMRLPVALPSPIVVRSPVVSHARVERRSPPVALRSPALALASPPLALRSPEGVRPHDLPWPHPESVVAFGPPSLPWPYSQAAAAVRPHNVPWPYSHSPTALGSHAAGARGPLQSPPPSARHPANGRNAATVAFGANGVAAERRWYNDTDFAFSGRWEHVRNRYDGRTNGSSSRSFHPGSQATLTFQGRSVRLYGVVGPGGGLGIVSVDGGEPQFVKFYGPVKSVHKVVYRSPPLAPGTHRVTISVFADPTLQAARARYVNIGGADV